MSFRKPESFTNLWFTSLFATHLFRTAAWILIHPNTRSSTPLINYAYSRCVDCFLSCLTQFHHRRDYAKRWQYLPFDKLPPQCDSSCVSQTAGWLHEISPNELLNEHTRRTLKITTRAFKQTHRFPDLNFEIGRGGSLAHLPILDRSNRRSNEKTARHQKDRLL